MATKAAITPYWERLPGFLVYPLYPPALWVVLSAAGLGAFAITQLGLFLVMIPVMLAILLAVVRYGYEVLARTAENELTPPPMDVLSSGYDLPLKQFLIIVCGMLAIGLTGHLLGPTAAFIVSIGVYLLVPASVIILAWTESGLAALNPAMLVQFVAAMRWHYAALFALLLLIGQGRNYLYIVIPSGLPAFPTVFLVFAIEFHFIIVLFHLMGYFLLQFGYRLGIEPPGVEDEDEAGEDYTHFEQFMQQGQYGAALGELREIADRRSEDMAIQRRLHRTAILASDNKVMARAADRLIAGHAAAGREREAAEVALETRENIPDYLPQQGDSYLPLARGLRAIGCPKVAVQLCNGFHKRFPNHADIPEVYGVVAWIFRGELNQDKQYDAICRFLKQHYPDHPTTISTTAFHQG